MATTFPPITQPVVTLGSGAPTDASYSPAPSDGQFYIDTATNLLYFRSKGTWQEVKGATSVSLLDPTGLIAESFPREAFLTSDGAAVASGTMNVVAVELPAGIQVNKVQFLAGATPESGGTHAWTALLDNTLVCRAVSADNTGAGAVAASALFGAAFAAPYVTTYEGIYYAGLVVVGTPPTLIAVAEPTALTTLAPKIAGTSTTGLTVPIVTGGAAQTAITATAFFPYVQVS